jgi:hypothetical protein
MLSLTSFSVEFFLDFLAPIIALAKVAVALIHAGFVFVWLPIDDVATAPAPEMPTGQGFDRHGRTWIFFSMSRWCKRPEARGAGNDEAENVEKLAHQA